MEYINLLPDHVLVQIFGNLSPGMIKSCCLVCKRWDEIIGMSSVLMGRFKLDLADVHENPWKKKAVIAEIQRKHQSIKIDRLKYSLDVIYRCNLKSLQLTCSGTNLSILVKALNNLPSLKVFDAKYLEFIDDISESSDSLKKVYTNIEELNCSVEIIHIFESCTVKKLSIFCKNRNENWKSMAVDFLKRQRCLENLHILSDRSNAFFTIPDIFNFNFSLKKFKHDTVKPFQFYEEFIQFLNQHKASLTSIDVHFNTDPQFGIEFIHKFALENIVNLKHLNMGYFEGEYEGDDDISFSELPAATQITRNLESLTIRARSTDMNENRRFFDMMPNLKYLNLDSTEDEDSDVELLFCISQRCPKLESLQVFYFNNEARLPGAIYFPKLKELIVGVDCNQLCAFIDRHSQTLERIVLKDVDEFTRCLARSILNCLNLNYLKLNISKLGIASAIMINDISSKSKPFTLVLPCQKFKFQFPDDKAIFDAMDDDNQFYINAN